MLQARIVSTRGSLYFACEVTPYDLENLRTHVRDFQATMSKDVRLELSLDRNGENRAAELQVSAWLRRIAADGVRVSLLPGSTSSGQGTPAAPTARSHRR